jgi:hypothetical protein
MEVKDEILKVLPKPPDQIKLSHIITALKVEKRPLIPGERKTDNERSGI